MQSPDEHAGLLVRMKLIKAAVADAIGENRQLSLRDSEPSAKEGIAAEVAEIDFSRWKSVPVA
ncbi:hypothetical protein SAMN05216535_3267 [Stutzerimonas xanthomarina]|uniref:Uncharacterized protein n=2 Tax=Stutzerimonas xanthomarina TaxID=271420 RepID=A0A1M5SD43_9GAMM|nr:hypothetical protein SAMN05216535_3267 [Stutzerimonas xanthomarina]SHH36381.1 hypothetical protein SAMN02744645_3415 [Stutzerimonas xanthomarina DSM 18231]